MFNLVDSIINYYDRLANHYHYIYDDWQKTTREQGEILDQLIRSEMGSHVHMVLDCACGIGTQAIGLAARGYDVHATDLSPLAIKRARAEAEIAHAKLRVSVADLRTLSSQVEGTFDVVLACDNAIANLLSEEDLQVAIYNMKAKLRANGMLLLSIRDYDRMTADKVRALTPRVFDDPDGRRIVFQVWDWALDGATYVGHLFILKEDHEGWHTLHSATTWRVVLRADLTRILHTAGFKQIHWYMSEESRYHQPIVTARMEV